MNCFTSLFFILIRLCLPSAVGQISMLEPSSSHSTGRLAACWINNPCSAVQNLTSTLEAELETESGTGTPCRLLEGGDWDGRHLSKAKPLLFSPSHFGEHWVLMSQVCINTSYYCKEETGTPDLLLESSWSCGVPSLPPSFLRKVERAKTPQRKAVHVPDKWCL